MFAALLLAAMQPVSLDALGAPASGSFGWIEQLAGSCFAGESGRAGTRRNECFAKSGGRFTITTVSSSPRTRVREECVLETADDMILRFGCSRDGGPRAIMIGRYEDGAFVTRRFSERRAATSPLERMRSVWRRVGADQLSMRVEVPDGTGWVPFTLSRPVLLTRQ